QVTLDQFASGGTDILLGTQMIAKGLDVANVRLVGVISGDTSLNFPDFRASERTFQLIAQVAGRAGRGEHRGRVVVQSFNPDDPAIQLAAQHDYVTFAQQEIKTRVEAGLPPVGRMARIVLRDTDHVANTKRAHELGHALRQAREQLNLNVRLRGPAVCPIARLADHHRQQIELISAPPGGAVSIQKLLTTLRNAGQLISDTHTAVDVDPVSLL
ncbi:MAG: helicase-related protein, partial [Planctomycetota bacterium]